MEKQLADLAALLQSMQRQRESIMTALDDNTAAVRDLSVGKPATSISASSTSFASPPSTSSGITSGVTKAVSSVHEPLVMAHARCSTPSHNRGGNTLSGEEKVQELGNLTGKVDELVVFRATLQTAPKVLDRENLAAVCEVLRPTDSGQSGLRPAGQSVTAAFTKCSMLCLNTAASTKASTLLQYGYGASMTMEAASALVRLAASLTGAAATVTNGSATTAGLTAWRLTTRRKENRRWDPGIFTRVPPRLGHIEDALNHLSLATPQPDLLELHKLQTVEKHLGRCLEARKAGDWKSVLRERDVAIAAGADSSALLLAARAEALLRLQLLDEADLAISSVSKWDYTSSTSSDAKFCGFLANTYLFYVHAQIDMASGRFDHAVSSIYKARIIEPGNTEVVTMHDKVKSVARARCLRNELSNSGKFSEACVAYGEGLKQHPVNKFLYSIRASCRFKLEKWEKSIEDCNEALKVPPNYTKALLRRSASYGKMERWTESVKDYEILRKELPGDAEVAEACFHAQVAPKSSRGEEVYNMKFGGEVETIIVKALEITGQRSIINKGWGGLGTLSEPKDFVYLLDNCPHDRLCLHYTAVVYHGPHTQVSSELPNITDHLHYPEQVVQRRVLSGFFWERGGSWANPYGDFFLSWYAGQLVGHGDHVLGMPNAVFGGKPMALSAKIPFVHWWHGVQSRPAEAAAGFYMRNKENRYSHVAKMFARHGCTMVVPGMDVCLNKQHHSTGCTPDTLLVQMKKACHRHGARIAGENALLVMTHIISFSRICSNILTTELMRPCHFTYLHMGAEFFSPDHFPQFMEFVRSIVCGEWDDVPQLLLKWSSWLAQLATWEDEAAIEQSFPGAEAWGQASFQEGEYVTIPVNVTEDSMEAARPRRESRPNTRISGPEWVQ